MLEKITTYYGKFPDSLVRQIIFNPVTGNRASNIEVTLSCYNIKHEMRPEIIKLCFKDIVEIKLTQFKNNPSMFLDEIYINNINGLIVFDFFPIDHFDYLEENPNSNFIIKCNTINYEVL